MAKSIEEIEEDFELMLDWEDRYEYLMELGRALPALPESARDEAHKVQGCMSQVWILAEVAADAEGPPRLQLWGDSDSFLVKGLVGVVITALSGRTAEEILAINLASIFQRLGLDDHLSPNRRNGFVSMVRRVEGYAQILQSTRQLPP